MVHQIWKDCMTSAICGVYKITNTLDDKCYIGSAINVQTRLVDHFRQLRNNTHHNRYLQRAYNKYGEVFDVNVLIECTPKMLLLYEQYFMDQLKPEYNIEPKAGSSLGVKRSAEAKEKNRKAHIGKQYSKGCKHSHEWKLNMSLAMIGNHYVRGKHWKLSNDAKEHIRQAALHRHSKL
jgi:group I intron endonuclease